jgi:hypothetical protein
MSWDLRQLAEEIYGPETEAEEAEDFWKELGQVAVSDAFETRQEREAREYKRYRTGLTFADVRQLLKQEQERARAKGLYMWVSRSTVLGRWREIKLADFFGRQRPEHEPIGQWEFGW